MLLTDEEKDKSCHLGMLLDIDIHENPRLAPEFFLYLQILQTLRYR